MSNEGIAFIIDGYKNLIKTYVTAKNEFKFIDILLEDYEWSNYRTEVINVALDSYTSHFNKYQDNYNAKIMALQDTVYYVARSYEITHNVNLIPPEK